MHRFLALLASFVVSPVLAANYVYTNSYYFDTFYPYAACTIGSCANYAASMRVTGSFSTAAPLPAMLNFADIRGSITSFSINDGVNTISSSDPAARVQAARIWTDANGAVTQAQFVFQQWTSGTNGAHAVGDRLNIIEHDSPGIQDYVLNNVACSAMAGDACSTFTFDRNSSYGFIEDTTGTWVLQLSVVLERSTARPSVKKALSR